MRIVKYISKNWITFIIASLAVVVIIQFLNIVLLHPNMSYKRNFNLYIILPCILVIFGHIGGLFIYLFLKLASKVQSLAVYRNLYAYGLLILIVVFFTLISIQIYKWFTTKDALFYLFALPGLIIVPTKAFNDSLKLKD